MMKLWMVGLLAVICVSVVLGKSGKSCKTRYPGCRLNVANGQCECGVLEACKNPFPYFNMYECWMDKYGRLDKCKYNPCVNKGYCVQVKVNNKRTWHCHCASTGFYGRKCHLRCPRYRFPLPRNYPAACIF